MALADVARDVATDALIALSRQTGHQHHGHNHGHGHNHNQHSFCETASCRRSWKIGFAVALFVEGLLFGYVPLFLRRYACMSSHTFRRLLHFINAAGGGVFLATGLLHIMPEAVELFQGTSHADHTPEFPVPYAIALGTFFVFLLFDRVIFANGHAHAGGRKTVANPEDDEDDDEFGRYEDFDAVVDNESQEGSGMHHSLVSSGGLSSTRSMYGVTSAAFATAGFTTLGIGAHSLFESVALGSASHFSTALNAFIAISAHRWATAMALGSRYAKADLNTTAYSLLILLFSAVAPMGVFVGFATENLPPAFQGAIFAISAGTFLYIGAFETLAHEFVAHPTHLVGKFCVMVAGASLMVTVTGILVATKVH